MDCRLNMHWPSAFFIVNGIGISLQYTLISLTISCLLGVLFACIQVNANKIVAILIQAYISIFRGTPLLVQLCLIYFALPSITNITITGFTAGIITFSLNSAAYVSEIIRGGIQNIDKGQFDACRTLNIPYFFKMKDIILPQALRATFPALTNEMTSLLKETALISTIGEADIMRRAHLVSIEHYIYFEPLLIAAGCYYCLVLLINIGAKHIEKKICHDNHFKSQ